jgi:putative sigma-54 modulation protein
MTVDVRSVHFDLSDANKAYLDKKLERIAYARDLIVDLLFSFTKGKQFQCDCTVNFRWGTQAHVSETDFDLIAGMDKLIDTLEQKINKEKKKVQDKK